MAIQFAKIIDIYLGVADNAVLNSGGSPVKDGLITTFAQAPVLGDTVLFRFHMFDQADSGTAYAVPYGAMFEFVVADRTGAAVGNVMAYAGDTRFNPVYWPGGSGWSRADGRICGLVVFDRQALVDDLGTGADALVEKEYYGELVMTPPPTSEGAHITLWSGKITVRNSNYRAGTSVHEEPIWPPIYESSSSSSESSSSSSDSSSSSTSQSSSSSTEAMTTSSSDSSSSSSTEIRTSSSSSSSSTQAQSTSSESSQSSSSSSESSSSSSPSSSSSSTEFQTSSSSSSSSTAAQSTSSESSDSSSSTAGKSTSSESSSSTAGAWDLSALDFDTDFSVNTQITTPESLAFSTDGTKMYVAGDHALGRKIHQYTLSTAWDIGTASYANKSFDTSALTDNFTILISFKSDGTKMYVGAGFGSAYFYQYSLSTAWDVSTASSDSLNVFTGGKDGSPFGFYFKSDGTKMYIYGNTNSRIYEWNLSTAWNISTATYLKQSATVQSNGRGLFLKPDGKKAYVVSLLSDKVHEYSLSTAWDISTLSNPNIDFSIASQDNSPRGLFFAANGRTMHIGGDQNNKVYQYLM